MTALRESLVRRIRTVRSVLASRADAHVESSPSELRVHSVDSFPLRTSSRN